MSERMNYRPAADNKEWVAGLPERRKNDMINQAVREFRLKSGGREMMPEEEEVQELEVLIEEQVRTIASAGRKIKAMNMEKEILLNIIRESRQAEDDRRAEQVLKAVPVK